MSKFYDELIALVERYTAEETPRKEMVSALNRAYEKLLSED